jgi:hypothetical protein
MSCDVAPRPTSHGSQAAISSTVATVAYYRSMSREMALPLLGIMTVWAAAVAIKAAKALVGDTEYRFGRWDGGLMRQGNTLTRAGTWVKLMVGVVLAFGIVTVFAGLFPVRIGGWVIIAVAGVSVVSDIVNVQR